MPRSKKRRPKSGSVQQPASLKSAVHALQRQNFSKAEKLCRAILAREPGNAEALNLMGGIHMMAGNAASAVDALTRAVSLKPGDAAIASNLGAALAGARRFEEAETHFVKALARAPGDTEILANLGRARLELGKCGPALENFSAVLRAEPGNVDILVDAARAAFAGGDAASAELYLGRALAIDPLNASALKELVRLLYESSRWSEGLSRVDAALANDDGNASLHRDKGLLLARLQRYDDALASFDRALAREPDSADARFGRALINLSLGRYEAGWQDYRARQSMRDPAAPDSMAAAGRAYHREALPRDLAGKRVLVVGDQGLGDELFFLRFARGLRDRGAQVAYQPDARLAAMLGRARIADEILTAPAADAAYDFRLSVGDLPYLLGNGDDDARPASIGIPPLPDRRAEIEASLTAFGDGPYIGVTWRAGSAGDNRVLHKEVPMDLLARTVAGLSGSIVILQRNPGGGEVEAFAHAAGRPVLDLSALNTDLEGIHALCALLDIYVGVSNTNTHFREACGRPSHVLIPYPAEFRWMASGSESPWFPGSRLFRQSSDGDWTAAIAALAADLDAGAPALKAAS